MSSRFSCGPAMTSLPSLSSAYQTPSVELLPSLIGGRFDASLTASYCLMPPVWPADGPPVTSALPGSGLPEGPMTFGSQS